MKVLDCVFITSFQVMLILLRPIVYFEYTMVLEQLFSAKG